MNKLLLVIILVHVRGAFAQILPVNHSIQLVPIMGSQLFKDQGHSFHDIIMGADIGYYKEVGLNSDNWIKQTNTKSYGLEFTFRDLSRLKGRQDTSSGKFGQVYGLSGAVNFELFKIGRAKFNLGPSMGLSYTSKYYHNGNKNGFLSIPFNLLLKANIGMELPVAKNLDFLMGVGFLHLSNAGMVIPNGGLNMGNVYLGLKLSNRQEIRPPVTSRYKCLARNAIEISAGVGKRGIYGERTKGLYRGGVYLGYNYFLNDAFNLKAGLDAVYYFTTYDPNDFSGTYQYYGTSYKNWRTGISVGGDINLWRITYTGQVGKYIYYDSYFKDITWYWVMGPSYNITPHIGLFLMVYLHYAQADYINYSIRYRF